jgi:glutaminyl-tRNA synthetase
LHNSIALNGFFVFISKSNSESSLFSSTCLTIVSLKRLQSNKQPEKLKTKFSFSSKINFFFAHGKSLSCKRKEKNKMTDRRALFLSIGCSEKFVDDFLKSSTKSSVLEQVITEAGISSSAGCSESIGALLLEVATKFPQHAVVPFRALVLQYIMQGKVANIPQVTAAIAYCKSCKVWDAKEFERVCGVGVVVTDQDIKAVLEGEIQKVKDELVKERYAFDVMSVLRKAREVLPWADGKKLKEMFDAEIVALIGVKTEEDGKKKKAKKQEETKVKDETKDAVDEEAAAAAAAFIEQHYAGRDLPEARNTAEILEKHNKITGGKIRSRFPPEPNGFLHIGHAKAMNFNFGLATRSNGVCFLRFDDTNPSAEEQRFIDNIIENVHWLGHKPYQITYSSDYFPLLYDLAIELIKRGKAYVCHQTQEEIKEYRKKKNMQDPSPWRDRPVEENLREFEKMRRGVYEEGKATLRMKIDIRNINPCMWDPVAYRIKYEAHPHVKDAWCIYPSYDYTHCLVDSIEHITNSCCTLEFEIRRDSYYWLLAALDLYRPMVWEYSRLNITHSVLSKRKLKYLVVNNLVRGWDDPRLLTLNGLRRRGVSPAAINDFCNRIGVSRTTTGYTKYDLLEACIRSDMDSSAPRTMVVLDPVKVTISNWNGGVEKFEIFDFPKHPEKGAHSISLSSTVFIERSDFRKSDEKGFYGLAPGKTVRLKYAYNITCESFVADKEGNVLEVKVKIDKENKEKVKGNLHWVSGATPLSVIVRVYDYLFTEEFPGAKKKASEAKEATDVELEEEEEEVVNDGKPAWLKELNPNSETLYSNALADSYIQLRSGNEFAQQAFQFERLGYFVTDPDATLKTPVFNRTVALKSSKEK